MSHFDDYEVERSHELERRLDRDAEREPSGPRRYMWPRTVKMWFKQPDTLIREVA